MPARANPRVLIVEDESLMGWSLQERLQQAGYRVMVVTTGQAALDYLPQGTDVVLLDWKLPDLDGVVVLQKIKENCPDCPVIMMTAFDADELDRQTQGLGVHRLVDKPFSLDEMLQLVEEALTPAHM